MKKRGTFVAALMGAGLAAGPAFAQATGDVNIDVTVQAEPRVELTLNGDLAANITGEETGNFIPVSNSSGGADVRGCLITSLETVVITVESAGPDQAGNFALTAPGVDTKIVYAPEVGLRFPSGSFSSLISIIDRSGVTETVELDLEDVDGSDCTAKADNIRVGVSILNLTSASSGNSGGPKYVIDQESLDDGVARTFSDTLTVTVAPGL